MAGRLQCRHSRGSGNPATSSLRPGARRAGKTQGRWVDSLHPQAALRAIRCANVRSGILPAQSAFAGMTMRGMLGALVLCVAACSQAPAPVTFHADGYPEKLGDWNVVYRDGDALALNDRVVPFDLNTPLFSDYAHKLRTVWMPEGAHARSEAPEAPALRTEEHTSELQSLMR